MSNGLSTKLAGVTAVGFLTYAGEYMSYIIILAWISDKLLYQFGFGTASIFVVGLISSFYLVVSGLLAVPFGHLCDKYGRRKFTILGSMMGGFALLVLSLVGSLLEITIFATGITLVLLALTLGHATYTASTWAYVGDIAKENNLGKSYGLLELAEYAAYSFGPALGGAVALFVGREGTFLLSAAFMFAATATTVLLMPESVAAQGRFGGGQTIKLSALPSGLGSHEATTNEHTNSISWSSVAFAVRNPVVTVTLLTTFLMSLALQAFYIYIPLFAYRQTTTIPLVAFFAPALASVAAGTSIILMIPFGAVVDRTKRRMPMLVLGLLVGSGSLILVFFLRSLAFLAGSAFIFGVSLAMARVSQAVILAEGTSTVNRAAVMGTNHAIEHAGYGVGALVGGSLIALLGLAPTFGGLSILLFAAAVGFLIFALSRRIR